MGCGASKPEDPALAAAKRHLLKMDDAMVKVVASGDLRLVKASAIRDGTVTEFSPLQTLEAESPDVLCSPEEAAALMRKAIRCVAILSHAWFDGDQDHPDLSHGKMAALRNYLQHCEEVEAIFIDYMCVPQVLEPGTHERSEADQARYDRAAGVMPSLYASPMGTRVVRLKASDPARPYDDRGWCILETNSANEVVCRAMCYPKLKAVLDALPPKLLDIGGANIEDTSYDPEAPPTVVEMPPARPGGERV